MYDMATQFDNSSWARFLDERLEGFINSPDEVAYKASPAAFHVHVTAGCRIHGTVMIGTFQVLHNITMSWDTAVGCVHAMQPSAIKSLHLDRCAVTTLGCFPLPT